MIDAVTAKFPTRFKIPIDSLAASDRLSTFCSIAVICILLSALAMGTWQSFPAWDDAWLSMLVKEHGVGAIQPAIPDRPVGAAILRFVVELGPGPFIFISVGMWLALGLLSGEIFSILFTELKGYKVLVTVITVSPVLAKVHLAGFNVAIFALLPVSLAYLGLLLVYKNSVEPVRKIGLLVAGFVAFAIGCMISEYGIPVVLVTIVLLLPQLKIPERRLRVLGSIMILGLIMLTTYAFLALNARSNTSPAFFAENIGISLKKLPFNLFGSVWHAAVGAYVNAMGLTSNLSFSNRIAYLCFAFGIVLSVLLIFSVKPIKKPRWSVSLTLLLCLVAGILPICLMSRIPFPGEVTRFFIPLIPVSSMLFVFLLAAITTTKAAFIKPLVVGLICGSSMIDLVSKGIAQTERARDYSDLVRPIVQHSAGLVLLVADSDMNDYTLTGKITKDWASEEQLRFWATDRVRAANEIGDRTNCNLEGFSREIRMVERQGPVTNALLLNPDGTLENYCVAVP